MARRTRRIPPRRGARAAAAAAVVAVVATLAAGLAGGTRGAAATGPSPAVGRDATPPAVPAATGASSVTPYSVLVVGDSILAQAAAATRYWAPKGSSVWVFGGPGSAPCDWNAGYRDPFSGSWYRFSQLVDRYRPAAVVLAFSGNPGFSGPRAGCVDHTSSYSLSALLASYQQATVAMARYASDHGARVYLAASPPRNPATPPGAYRGAGGSHDYGFNGVPQINRLYAAIAGSPEGTRDSWTYDPAAAAAVSDDSLAWHLTEPCDLWDGSACGSDGRVPVRAGGYDSVHLDSRGAGATRYGQAVVRGPLEDQGYLG